MRRNYVILGAVFMAALIGGCKKEKEREKVVVKLEKAGTDTFRSGVKSTCRQVDLMVEMAVVVEMSFLRWMKA